MLIFPTFNSVTLTDVHCIVLYQLPSSDALTLLFVLLCFIFIHFLPHSAFVLLFCLDDATVGVTFRFLGVRGAMF